MVHNAVGIFIKHAGRRDPAAQSRCLDSYSSTMPRSGLRLAIVQLDPEKRAHYMNAARAAAN